MAPTIQELAVEETKYAIVTLKSESLDIPSSNDFYNIEKQIDKLVSEEIYEVGIKLNVPESNYPSRNDKFSYGHTIINFAKRVSSKHKKLNISFICTDPFAITALTFFDKRAECHLDIQSFEEECNYKLEDLEELVKSKELVKH